MICNLKRLAATVTLAALGLGLAACGGGSDGAANPAADDAAAETAAAPHKSTGTALDETAPAVETAAVASTATLGVRVGGGTGAAGSVVSAPAGINCTTACSATYATNTKVTLTATARPGYVFTGWSGACTGTAPCATTLSANRSVAAGFARGATSALSVAVSGLGTVTSGYSGINCGPTCVASFASGSTVSLTATPATGYTVTGWGGSCSGSATCAVTMSAARTVTAAFTATPVGTVSTIPLTLVADKAAAANAVVSLGVPFAPGVLSDDTKVAVLDASGTEVASSVTTLARWPRDGSIRSVLVAFRATLGQGASAAYKIAYGSARRANAASPIAANPDGPVAATLPASWYSASEVSGLLVPVAANKRFPAYDSTLESTLWTIDYSAYGVNCASTSSHRTYYDGAHAMYQLFLRTGDAKHYRRARQEALWYRANELRWYEGRAMAVQVCQPSGWTPGVALDWNVLRRMASQGMLDDHLLTGDPVAREAVLGLGEAYRRNLPALTAGSAPGIEATERNLGWPIMGLSSYLALDNRSVVRDALVSLVDRTIAWQARGSSGAFEHDLVRPDPSECGNGPRGASPFMTSLLVDGLMDYHQLTADARVADVLKKVASWYETKAITSDRKAFRYLWNCLDNAYDDSSTADLNLLIGHVFGATYALTSDTRWLTLGDAMATAGVEAIYTKRPKQWNQTARSFGKYLGYRSRALPP